MAQVRKYSTGGETSPKLLKREGYGDYNVADIESQYAKNLNGILDEMGLEGEDRQKVIETTKNIMSNITNGTINTINSSGQWIVPKEYSSTGYNTYKNAGLFGMKGKKVVRAQNFYNNTAYYILDNVLNNTNTYTEKEIVNLISNANYNNKEEKNYLNFNLVFCGDFDDLPNNIGSPIDFIMKNKERIVAVYRYVKSTEERDFFIGFSQSETIYNYSYLYLSLAKLLEQFEKNNVKCEIDTTVDKFAPAMYRDDTATNFVISYSPKKEIESEKGQQLKKVRKDV